MPGTRNGSLKERCIDESLRIIAEEGVRNLSIREVARRLGVSHGAPYRHFSNRDALITEIAIRGLAVLREYLLSEVDYELNTPRDNFLNMCRNYLRFAMEQHDYFQLILWTDLPRTADEYPLLASEANKVFQLVMDLIKYVQGHTNAKPADDRRSMLHVFSTIHGYASLMSSGKLSVFHFSLDDLERYASEIADELYASLTA